MNLKEFYSINTIRDAPLGIAVNPYLSIQDDEHHGRDEGGPRRAYRCGRPRRPSTFSAAFSTDDRLPRAFPAENVDENTTSRQQKQVQPSRSTARRSQGSEHEQTMSSLICVVCVDSGWGTQYSESRLSVFFLLLFLAKKANRQHGPRHQRPFAAPC
jgi:hypothetical protein